MDFVDLLIDGIVITIGIGLVLFMAWISYHTIKFLKTLFLDQAEESIDVKPPLDSAVRWYMDHILEQLPEAHEISVFQADNINVISIMKIGTRTTIHTVEDQDLGMAWRKMYQYVMGRNPE